MEAMQEKGLKVIGAGFGRTGTLSMKAALESLGFAPCYHMTEVFQNAEEMVPNWIAAIEGKPLHWDSIFGRYQATVDWPGCSFYEQLMQAYPDAKVLLNVRDPNAWYESVISTIYQTSKIGTTVPLPQDDARLRWVQAINTLIWQRTFDGRFEDKAYALSVFERHNEEVKRKVPAEKLLVYNVKEGWEPLCAFLGVEVPKDRPFPRLNERTDFINRIGEIRHYNSRREGE